MIVTVNAKPLSVNQVWQGKRFKTKAYKTYETEVMLLLPNEYSVPEGDLKLSITAGLSSKQSDIDNIAKPFIDILQKKYDFNDSRIYCLLMVKQVVPKGGEFMSFAIEQILAEIGA